MISSLNKDDGYATVSSMEPSCRDGSRALGPTPHDQAGNSLVQNIGFDTLFLAQSPPHVTERGLTTPPPIVPLLHSTGIQESSSVPLVSASQVTTTSAEVVSGVPMISRTRRKRKSRKIPDVLTGLQLEEAMSDFNEHETVQLRRSLRKRPCDFRALHDPPPTLTLIDVAPTPLANAPYQAGRYWCHECYKMCPGEDCPYHPYKVVVDRRVSSYARLSLPYILSIKSVDQDEFQMGVFAKRTIEKRTLFGPFVAQLVSVPPVDERGLSLRIDPVSTDGTGEPAFLHFDDENYSNWMMFVRPANNADEQNLVAFQLGQHIYFSTVCIIRPKEELKVWYAPNYARHLGLQLLSPLPVVHEEVEEDTERQTQSSTGLHQINSFAVYRARRTVKRILRHNMRKMVGHTRVTKDPPDEIHCFLCRLTFTAEDAFQMHKLTHPGEATARGMTQSELIRECQCTVCYTDLPGVLDLAQHMTEHALTTPKIFSPSLATWTGAAGRSVKSVPENVVHNRELCYGCGGCGTLFRDRMSLDRHKLMQHRGHKMGRQRGSVNVDLDAEEPPVEEKGEPGLPLLDEPAKPDSRRPSKRRCTGPGSFDAGDPAEYVCPVCDVIFSNPWSLSTHTKVHKDSSFYKCLVCNLELANSKALRTHSVEHRTEQPDGPAVYACPICKKRQYPTWSQLVTHMRQIHTNKLFPCSYCSKTFARRSKLNNHILTHTGERAFVCSLCGKAFKRRDQLMKHAHAMHKKKPDAADVEASIPAIINNQRLNHSEAKRPKRQPPKAFELFTFRCEPCRLGFKRRGMLVNHMLKRHPNVPIESVPELAMPIIQPVREYYCPDCLCVYRTRSRRREHIRRVHPHRRGISPSNSPGKEGVWTDSAHIANLASMPLRCPVCQREYGSKNRLVRHARSSHPGIALHFGQEEGIQELVETEPTQEQLVMPTTSNTDDIAMNAPSSTPMIAFATSMSTQTCAGSGSGDILNDDLLTQAMNTLTSSGHFPHNGPFQLVTLTPNMNNTDTVLDHNMRSSQFSVPSNGLGPEMTLMGMNEHQEPMVSDNLGQLLASFITASGAGPSQVVHSAPFQTPQIVLHGPHGQVQHNNVIDITLDQNFLQSDSNLEQQNQPYQILGTLDASQVDAATWNMLTQQWAPQ